MAWPCGVSGEVGFGKNEITVARSFIRAFALLVPKDYPTLRDFYQKVAAADQQQLVLKVAPATGGN